MVGYDRHFRLTETRDPEIVVFEEQYRALRKEILDRQQRRFFIVAGATLGIPSVSGLKLTGVMDGAFLFVVPFVVVAMSFLFVIEVNGIARAGRFIERRIENNYRSVHGWEHFLNDLRHLSENPVDSRTEHLADIKDLEDTNELNPQVVQMANRSFLLLMIVYFVFSTLIATWRLLFLHSEKGASIGDAIATGSSAAALIYFVGMVAVFAAWVFGMSPHLGFSAEAQKASVQTSSR